MLAQLDPVSRQLTIDLTDRVNWTLVVQYAKKLELYDPFTTWAVRKCLSTIMNEQGADLDAFTESTDPFLTEEYMWYLEQNQCPAQIQFVNADGETTHIYQKLETHPNDKSNIT